MKKKISEETIVAYLNSKGFKHANLGYTYLKCALTTCIRWDDLFKVSLLYKDIAERYNTTPTGVERAIRHALETSKLGVTNKEFITKALDDLKYGVSEIVISDEQAHKAMHDEQRLFGSRALADI